MSKYGRKLGADESYQRPKKTYQEQLTAEEIEEKLDGYVKVDDLDEVPLNTHMRYFTTDKRGQKVFRMGGFLYRRDDDRYVILTNGKDRWSVQRADAVFYRKLSHKEEIEQMKEAFQKELHKRNSMIRKLKKKIDELQEELEASRTSRKSRR